MQDNIYYLTGGKNINGYVFNFSVRGGTDAFKNYLLDNKGYTGSDGNPAGSYAAFKIKSRRIARDISVSMKSGKKAKRTVHEKQVVLWAKKYADKVAAERQEAVKRAMELVENPAKYNRAVAYGAAKYVKNVQFGKKTDEILKSGKSPHFDFDRLAEEEKYDGYYAIFTSELKMSDGEIIDTYRGCGRSRRHLRSLRHYRGTTGIRLKRGPYRSPLSYLLYSPGHHKAYTEEDQPEVFSGKDYLLS